MNSARKTKVKLKTHKPRNPLVAPAQQRKAGSHRKSGKSARQQDRMNVQAALRELAT